MFGPCLLSNHILKQNPDNWSWRGRVKKKWELQASLDFGESSASSLGREYWAMGLRWRLVVFRGEVLWGVSMDHILLSSLFGSWSHWSGSKGPLLPGSAMIFTAIRLTSMMVLFLDHLLSFPWFWKIFTLSWCSFDDSWCFFVLYNLA